MKDFHSNKTILAIDPANACGWALFDAATKEVTSGTWMLGKISSSSAAAQLDALCRMLAVKIKQHNVKQIAYEQAAIGQNNRAVAAHYEKIAIIKLVCVRAGIECGPAYWISQIKKHATGNGRAEKLEVMRAAITLLGRRPADDNEADALWILNMVCQGIGVAKKERSKPKKKREDLPGQMSLFGQKPRRVIRPE